MEMEKHVLTFYALFYGGDSQKVIVYKVQGELRLNKRHPRIFVNWVSNELEPYGRYTFCIGCIGLEHFGKTLFNTEQEALSKAKQLNDAKLDSLTWEKEYRATSARANWLSKDEALILLGDINQRK